MTAGAAQPTPEPRPAGSAAVIRQGALVAAVAVLTVFLGLRNGGYFAGGTAVAALVVGGLLLVWLVAAPDPIAALTRPGVIGIVALGVLAIVDLTSSARSDSPARAVVEFDRTLLYGMAFTLFACAGGGRRTLRMLVAGVGAAFAVLAAAGVLARLAPGLLDVTEARAGGRLSWPIGYWNGLGLAAALGLVACAGTAADRRVPAAVRGVFAACLPTLAVAGYLTLSRGAVLVAAAGIVLLLARPGRVALAPLAGAVIAAAVAVAVAYDAEALVADGSTRAQLAHAGRPVLLVLSAATLVALVAGTVAARLTRSVAPGRRWRTRTRAGVVVAAVLAVLAVGVAAGGAHEVRHQWHLATRSGLTAGGADPRDRLAQAGANGRMDNWKVAVDGFERHPLLGSGTGTYDLDWSRERTIPLDVQDAHSLYLETASERGVVGLLLLLVALGAGAFATGRRGAGTAALAPVAMWLLHAGLDWDWEQPAVTVWAFAVMGAACAADRPAVPRGAGSALRLVAGLGVGMVLLTPLAIARSQTSIAGALTAFAHGDCRAAVDRSLQAVERAGWRPEAYQPLAYCDVRLGQDALARRAADNLVDRDPHNPRYLYARALVVGATGGDPQPGLEAALRADPLDPVFRRAVAAARHRPRLRDRQRLARRLPLLLPGGGTP